MFWLVILCCKFTFAYFLQASINSWFWMSWSNGYDSFVVDYIFWNLKEQMIFPYLLYYWHPIMLLLQIKPLVVPTRLIIELRTSTYSWHDLISKSMFPLSFLFAWSYIHCISKLLYGWNSSNQLEKFLNVFCWCQHKSSLNCFFVIYLCATFVLSWHMKQ